MNYRDLLQSKERRATTATGAQQKLRGATLERASREWRLKAHAVEPCWDWMASWCRAAAMPSDLGDDDARFLLPALRTLRHHTQTVKMPAGVGDLFGVQNVSATDMHAVKRRTAATRAALAADLVTAEPGESWVVWCDTDYEADAIVEALAGVDGVAEVRGSHLGTGRTARVWMRLDSQWQPT